MHTYLRMFCLFLYRCNCLKTETLKGYLTNLFWQPNKKLEIVFSELTKFLAKSGLTQLD